MNVLDIVILVAALAYGLTGFRNGAVIGALSLVGFFAGAWVGGQVAEPLGSLVTHGRAQVALAIVCVVVLAVLGQMVGVLIGHKLRSRFLHRTGRRVDAVIGLVFGVVSVLLVAWIIAVPLASSPYPSLSAEASGSTIVRGVNDVMPNSMRALYGKMRGYLDQSGFPPLFGDLPSTSIANVGPPPRSLTPDETRRLRVAEQSIVKIYGTAEQCDRTIEGSGFVISPQHVMTNAHVVAGTDALSIVSYTGTTLASADGSPDDPRVVYFDPQTDVAVIYVPGLSAAPLQFASRTAGAADPAIVVGYPEDGPLTPGPARIRERMQIAGDDIYGHAAPSRSVYSIRGVVRSGNSGGPLLGPQARVLGVVFATDLRSSDTGYALTDSEIAQAHTAGSTATAAVSTQTCTPD